MIKKHIYFHTKFLFSIFEFIFLLLIIISVIKFNWYITDNLLYDSFGNLQITPYALRIVILILGLLFAKIYKNYIFLNYEKNILNKWSFFYCFFFYIIIYISSILPFYNNLLYIIVLLEIQNVCVYGLIALHRKERRDNFIFNYKKNINNKFNGLTDTNLYSFFMYLIYNSLTSCLFFFGLYFIYSSIGSVDLSDIRLVLDFQTLSLTNSFSSTPILLGFLFVFSSFCLKFHIFPFHGWIGLIFEDLPLFVSIITIFNKISLLYIFSNFLYSFNFILLESPGQEIFWQKIMLFLAISSSLYGALDAIRQKMTRKILASTSITTSGFFFIGLYCNSNFMLSAVLGYSILYVLTYISLYAYMSNSIHFRSSISNFRFLIYTGTINIFLICILFMNLAGIPPMPLFFVKLEYFYTIISLDEYFILIFFILSNIFIFVVYVKILTILIRMFVNEYLNIKNFNNKSFKVFEIKNFKIVLSVTIFFFLISIFYPTFFSIFVDFILEKSYF